MSNREVYLDSLLQSVANPGNTQKTDTVNMSGTSEAGPAEASGAKSAGGGGSRGKSSAARPARRKRTAKSTPEDEFLKSFEQEFLDVDSDRFLQEFEESLGVRREEEVTVEEAEDEFVDAIDDMMVDTMSGEDLADFGLDAVDSEPEPAPGRKGARGSDRASASRKSAPKRTEPAPEAAPASRKSAPKKAEATPEPAPASRKAGPVSASEKAEPAPASEKAEPAPSPELGMLFDDLDLTGVDFEVLGGEPELMSVPEPASAPEPKEPLEESLESLEDDADAELIDLLAGMSGDSDIAQITDMLKAHDNDQQMFEDEMTDLDMSGGGSGDELGFLDDLQAEGEKDSPKKKKREKKKKEKKEKKPRKKDKKSTEKKEEAAGGFLSRVSGTLFGEDEPDEPAGSAKGRQTLDGINLENISEENRSILMEMDREQEEKGKKKKEKKEKKPKKEKPAKKKAPKPPKPKKEKKPKEKGEPIPVKPLILTIALGVSVVVLVILGSNLIGYSSGVAAAEEAYNRGNYVEAYQEIEGLEIKKGDQKFYDRVRTSAYVQKQLDFSEVYQSAGMYPEALDALCQALNRYDTFFAEAEEAGSDGELAGMYTAIETRLSEDFAVTAEEAREIFAREERKDYTAGIRELLQRNGLPVE